MKSSELRRVQKGTGLGGNKHMTGSQCLLWAQVDRSESLNFIHNSQKCISLLSFGPAYPSTHWVTLSGCLQPPQSAHG